MTKLRLTAAAIAAAAVLAPAAAQASTYQPAAVDDPTGDVYSATTQANVDRPSTDITALGANRTDGRFKITVQYAKLDQTVRTRRFAYLFSFGENGPQGNVIELRTNPNGSRSTTMYALAPTAEAPVSATVKGCPGVKATPDFKASTVTYVLPTSCYLGTDLDGAAVGAVSARWSAASWQGGDRVGNIVGGDHEASLSDSALVGWSWTGDVVIPRPHAVRSNPLDVFRR